MKTQDAQDKYINYQLLTRKEAAKYLGTKESTLAVWACTKRYQLPMVKVGRLAKYRLCDLTAFIEKRLVNKAEEDGL